METAIKLFGMSPITHSFSFKQKDRTGTVGRKGREKEIWTYVFTRIDHNFYVKISKIEQLYIFI